MQNFIKLHNLLPLCKMRIYLQCDKLKRRVSSFVSTYLDRVFHFYWTLLFYRSKSRWRFTRFPINVYHGFSYIYIFRDLVNCFGIFCIHSFSCQIKSLVNINFCTQFLPPNICNLLSDCKLYIISSLNITRLIVKSVNSNR